MLKKTVVPLDGSPLSEVALPYAEEIAGKMGSDIILLSVLPSEDAYNYRKHQGYITKIAEDTRQHVEKYLESPADGTIKVEIATRVGNPAEGILDYVNKRISNLIVMATHGRSGIGRWAMGSVADKVARTTTKQPLMLIRAKGSHPDIRAKRILKKALIPLDGSTRGEAVIPYVAEIASHLRMELTLLQVIPVNNHSHTDTEAYLEGWCSFFADKGITARYEVRVGAAADQIIDLADEMVVDTVAMATKGHSAINLWPLGSVAQKVLLGGNTPLLLIKS